METTRLCPQCQQSLSADAPDGLCPQCLMRAASGPPPSAEGIGLAGDIIDIGDPAEVAKKLPQFEILEMLGRGGMGVVYKARQRNLDRIVALKILPPVDALSPDFVARFSREARALAKLNHPNIVNVHDFGETGGLYYIIMEYVDGMNLRQLLQTRRLTPAEALAIVPKICDALEYAHEEGLVHRDIKPENLLIDKKGRVKIADFGLAKLLRREPLDMTLTLSGMALGTLRYMAPEQMDKPETVDHRADLYSLGVVIYEMLTGETPVGRFELPSQKAQVDVRLDEIVLHALEKEPDRRYQHASEVKTDVEKVTSTPQVAPLSSVPQSAPTPKGDTPAVSPTPEADADMAQLSLSAVKAALGSLIIWAVTAAIIGVSVMSFTLHILWRFKDTSMQLLNSFFLGAGLMLVSLAALILLGAAWRHGKQRLAWIAGLLLVGVATGYAIGVVGPPEALISRAAIFFGAVSLGCTLVIRFGSNMPGAFAGLAAARREALARKAACASESMGSVENPAESDVVRRARASWFGRRSERFRTLLPPGLVFLEIALLLASFAGWPSPWLEWTQTYTPHKHGVARSTSSFAFHPLTFSFCLFVTGWACAFLSGRFSRIDNLVRYGCRFRELRKDIQRQAKGKIFGCLAVAMLLPFLISVLFQVITSGGALRTAGNIYYEFQLWPNSKAYEELLIDLPFYSNFENGVEHYHRPNEWDMTIGLKIKESVEPVTMDIEMPSLRASYLRKPGQQFPMNIVLDLDEFTKWMASQGRVDVKDEKVKKEAAELMALLKQFSRQAPVEMNEYFAASEEMMPDLSFAGFRGWPGKTSSFSSMNGGWITVIYLASAGICLALYFVVAIRIQRAAFMLDREVRERGESVLARSPLPRVRFCALPANIRASLIRRAVFCGALLLFAPFALVSFWESARPAHVKRTYHYDFAPRPTMEKLPAAEIAVPSPLLKRFQEVVMNFSFESYERDGEKWFVQPHPFLLELTFCRPKNFATKPMTIETRYQPGNGLPEGETFSFTIELPGLHANLDYGNEPVGGWSKGYTVRNGKSSVTLDEEELLRWMQYNLAATVVPAINAPVSGEAMNMMRDGKLVTLLIPPISETPELKSLAADLMAFLKKYAISAPTTHDAFLAAAQKIPSLRWQAATGVPREELTRENITIIPALGAAVLVFLALLPLLKRSAVRAAMRQGTLSIAPQTPPPASNEKPGEEKLVSEPRLSRLALWGAILIPTFSIMAAFMLIPVVASSYGVGGQAWWQIPVLMFTVLPAVVLLPFVSTILGAIAVAKIKRSNGKLYGLRLAAADVLFFPLLLLTALAVFIAHSLGLSIAFASLITLVVCFLVGRALWRAIVSPARTARC